MKFLLAGALCLLLAACAQPAPPQYVRAADGAVPVPRPAVPNVTAGARDFRIAGPSDWTMINRRVTPKTKDARP